LSLAVDEGVNWAILIGEDELAKKDVTLKDLATRQQKRVALDKVIQHLMSS
jgi:histidyl-tRNA synthetase